MPLVKVENGSASVYPYTERKLRQDNPSTSFPKPIPTSMLESYGVYAVTISSKPTFDERTQKVTQDALPALVNNEWVIGWSVSNKTSEEISDHNEQLEESNREKRNYLISQTDYFALSDITMSAAMTTYRQALRDITTHANWPNLSESDWPVKP